jgi:hypothetical protein
MYSLQSATFDFKRLHTSFQSAATEDRDHLQSDLATLRSEVLQHSLKIWNLRMLGKGATGTIPLHLSAQPHIYREMMVPYNALRHALKKGGLNPDDVGLTEGFLFQEALRKVTTPIRQQLDVKRERVEDLTALILEQSLNALRHAGVSKESPEVTSLLELQREWMAFVRAPLAQYVELVKESLELRELVAGDLISQKQEERLAAIASYLHQNEREMVQRIRNLEEEGRVAVLGELKLYDFTQMVHTARQRYQTRRQIATNRKREEEEVAKQKLLDEHVRAAAQELELWRKIAIVECKNRYDHENIAMNNDYDPDGHFYAGPEEMQWLVEPDEFDPGVLGKVPGAHCLCHFHLIEGDRYVPRQYSKDGTAVKVSAATTAA